MLALTEPPLGFESLAWPGFGLRPNPGENLATTFLRIRTDLTNRFHVAVHLSSNRSQMTSKCGKNKKVAHEAIAECVTDVLTTF